MRLPRIFTPQVLSTGAVLRLEEGPAHHLRQVLRLGIDGLVILFNGDGREARARVHRLNRRDLELEILALSEPEPEPALRLTLAQGISKGDRMDFALQKAVELGIDTFVPLLTERSVVRLQGERLARRLEHWERVAIGACEQSGRARLVRVDPATDLDSWLSADPTPAILLHPGAELTLRDMEPPRERITLLVGPEGGLSDQETERAMAKGLIPVRLGPRILRTETAPLAALAAIQTLWGDF